MINFLAVGLGGALGASLRYSITLLMVRCAVNHSLGTLISNVLAGLACGFVVGVERGSSFVGPSIALFLATGMLGGLSTFSAFSLETVDFFKNSNYMAGSINILSNLSLSLFSVVLGLRAAKSLLGGVLAA